MNPPESMITLLFLKPVFPEHVFSCKCLSETKKGPHTDSIPRTQIQGKNVFHLACMVQNLLMHDHVLLQFVSGTGEKS